MAAAKKERVGHEELAAKVVASLPKAAKDRVEVAAKAGMTNLKVEGQIVAAVRSSGVRVFFPAAGSEAEVRDALAHAVDAHLTPDEFTD